MRAQEFVTEYKKYPTREYEGVTFTMMEKDGQLIVRALNDFGIAMGHVIFAMDGRELDPKDLAVDDRYQGQGIARVMYDYIKSQGFTINRSFDQTDAGAGFWNKHRGEDAYVWEDRDQGAAGIILYAADTGRYGLQQRSNEINDPGQWAAWGGGREPGETLEQCARRELGEESGYTGPIKLKFLDQNPKYTTFVGIVPTEFEPRENPEWQDYCWVEAGNWPSPMHPGVARALEKISLNEDSGSYNNKELDNVLADLCKLVIQGQKQDPDYFGLVGACVIGPNGKVSSTSHKKGNKWSHAERNAINKYEEQYGPISSDCAIVTTLSPCTNSMADRLGDSCLDFLDSKGITNVYAGYKDPTQNGHYTVTDNKTIKKICKGLADKFLKENFADGKVKGKSRPGRVKRAGASCAGSVTDLRAKAKKYGGEKGKMYHWCANMKGGKKK